MRTSMQKGYSKLASNSQEKRKGRNTMKNDKTELFETMPVGKALLTMANPTIISQLSFLENGLHFDVL